MTPADFQITACAILRTAVGWQTKIARKLEIEPRTVRRWLAAEEFPEWVEGRLAQMTGQQDLAPWPRDEWLIGDTVGLDGRRREYIAHLQVPRFVARVVECDTAGLPAADELPADVISGVVYAIDIETVLCEIAWIDEVAPGEIAAWLEAAGDAVDAG